MKRWISIFALSAGLLVGLRPAAASAQYGERWRLWQARRVPVAAQRRRAEGETARPPNANNGGRKPNPRTMAGLPPKWVENLRDMPPAEQERFMQNNEKFQSLPPARQAQIRQNLQKWNNLSPEKQNRIRATERMLENATPEQREHFRTEIVPKLAQMPPGERARVIGHWRRLQGMAPEQQQEALSDPMFMRGLSPDDQGIVRDLNSLGAPPRE